METPSVEEQGERLALFLTFLARRAKLRVFRVSRAQVSDGDTQQIMTVRAFPPSESCMRPKWIQGNPIILALAHLHCNENKR